MPVLSGPVILGFSQEDPGAVARVFNNFVKENEDLVVKGLGVSGDFVEATLLPPIHQTFLPLLKPIQQHPLLTYQQLHLKYLHWLI
jgi:ribosomal protein L10